MTHVFAAQPGHFTAANGYVDVELLARGGYSAYVHTQSDQSQCDFDEKMKEVDEGDLRFDEDGCHVRVYQPDERNLSVRAQGCSDRCGNASLDIPHAYRR